MTKKKSLFEKWGLVESTETETDFDQEAILASIRAQQAEIEGDSSGSTSETTNSSTLSVMFEEDENFLTIEEVYEKSNLSDASRSIFKVEEFNKHIPDNLPLDVKRQSIVGILSASGLQLDELLDDADKRIKALKDTMLITSQKSDQDIMEKEEEITNLLNKVDSLKQGILDRKLAQEQQNDFIEEEIGKIDNILKFVVGK